MSSSEKNESMIDHKVECLSISRSQVELYGPQTIKRWSYMHGARVWRLYVEGELTWMK